MKRRSFLQGTPALPVLMAGGLLTDQLRSAGDRDADPFHFRKTIDRARHVPGILLQFVATKEETNGAYALLEAKAIPGMEPPKHVHEHEDEAFYMLDGEMIVTIGEEDYKVQKGDYIFMPRGMPHTQKILSDSIHALILITPGGFEQYFWDLSAPAANFEIPPLPTEPPTEEQMKMMMEMNAKYGITNV